MTRSIAMMLVITGLLFFILLPKHITAQFGSMCVSQFALANQACSVIPSEDEEAVDRTNQVVHRHRRHGRKHDHGGDDADGDGNDGDATDSRDGNHPRANKDCCRWLQEVETSCVCEALRRLPTFLTRPQHTFLLAVGTTCELTFRCEGA